MNILVLGATGMAGHIISIYLSQIGYNVHTFSRSSFPFCYNIVGNICDNNDFLKKIDLNNYDVIINCIGILNQNAENNLANAILLNSYLPHRIVEELSGSRTKLIHLSTDCVFNGKTGPYIESSLSDGTSIYDKTKALGEVFSNKHLTFRNSIIGPDMKSDGIGLFNWFMSQTSQIQGYSNVIWNGVTTLTLAKAINHAIIENISGIYHLVNNNSISKFDLLNLFNKHFKVKAIEIVKNERISINKTLINTRSDFSFNVPSYEEMLVELKDWILKNKNLYPHYKI